MPQSRSWLRGPPCWRCWTFGWVENLFHMPVEFLPRGCVPAPRGTCALNCQGVMMPRQGPALLHLCPCLVCYQTKYSRARRDGLQTCAASLWWTAACHHFKREKKVGLWYLFNISSMMCFGPEMTKISFLPAFLRSQRNSQILLSCSECDSV